MRSSLKTILAATAVAASAAFFGGTAQASIFVGGVGQDTIVIGDKTFLNFSCSPGGTGSCDNGGVTYQAASTGFGILFNPSAGLDITTTGALVDRDVNLSFQVIITDPTTTTFRIADFLLNSLSGTTGSGAITDLLEVCADFNCNTVLIGPTLLSGAGYSFPDTTFPGGLTYTSVWVFDDIHTTAGALTNGTPGAVEISGLTKTVTQTTPEPASLLLVGAALLGMGFVRRRGSK